MSTRTINVRLVNGPLRAEAAPCVMGCGAFISFEGVVRPLEGDKPLLSLDYEAYEPMTTSQLQRLAAEVALKHELHLIDVTHSVGKVPVGEISFRLHVAAPHRAPALAAMGEFIDRLKAEVPLWKVALYKGDADV